MWYAKCFEGRERKSRMRYFLALLMFAGSLAAVPPQAGQTERPAAKASLTGCVDERDGQYLLTNDTDLQPKARLQPAAGSAEDNFAKHMGHKVTVRGKVSKETPLPVMTVESIEKISEECAPAPAPRQ
jgi:hypothetical protein